MEGPVVNQYQRETDEFQPVTVTVDGAAVTENVEFSVVPAGTRPVTFIPPMVVGAAIGVRVFALEPGNYRVFARVTSSPEVPVVDCGTFAVV